MGTETQVSSATFQSHFATLHHARALFFLLIRVGLNVLSHPRSIKRGSRELPQKKQDKHCSRVYVNVRIRYLNVLPVQYKLHYADTDWQTCSVSL